ncbi:hypothetical protein N657DRAFT_676767 [Parathielavia appendiculata]|uniref:GED domain-containing protein n=1 Tax=Parathielavia appendiculata TaxID=2587402 RepID=A0AAN6U9R8_9PEZI|nr:hypothetical protein N657DRAFT_676767 [Parathielavia appendiculata]
MPLSMVTRLELALDAPELAGGTSLDHTVSVIPDKNRGFADQERLRQFGGTVSSGVPFEQLMRSAVDLIGPKNYSVDLPGLVWNANHDQSLEDIKTIEYPSDRYMKRPRTIILAVVGGNSNSVQAHILAKARHFDPDGTRTIGVLTKPDLTESIGLEDMFFNLVKEKDKPNDFKLGCQEKWNLLPPSICGASALMQKLSVPLQQHIGKHVYVLRKQVLKALDDCETELNFYKDPPGKNFFRVAADPRGTPAQNLRARATEENGRSAMRIRAHGRKFNFSASNQHAPGEAPGDSVKRDFVRQELEMLLRQMRGSEFLMNSKPRAVYMLFQIYSEYWPMLAQEHRNNLGLPERCAFSKAEEVLEKMIIYYDLAAKTFFRNVITHVIKGYLLQGMYSIFYSAKVLGLSTETIEGIAAEDRETRDRRQTFRVQRKAIEEAEEICASLAFRFSDTRLTPPVYAEDGEDAAEDNSDDEFHPNEKSHGPRCRPNSITSRPSRRTRRPSTGDVQAAQHAARASEAAPHQRYTHQPTHVPSSTAYTPSRTDNSLNPPSPDHPLEDFYTTSSRPQQQAAHPPPPLLRPGKVRADDGSSHPSGQGQAYSPAPPRSLSTRTAQASAAAPPEQYYANAYASNNPYAPPAEAAEFEAMRRQARKIAGRLEVGDGVSLVRRGGVSGSDEVIARSLYHLMM